DAIKRRFAVDEDGRLVDRETMQMPDDPVVVREWKHDDRPDASPLARFMPEELKARFPGAAGASDCAHFTLTSRGGDERQRRAMVDRWTAEAAGRGRGPSERAWAANTAIALARQDDFLPELARRVRHGDRFALRTIFLGLAMRDVPRAVDLLFAA